MYKQTSIELDKLLVSTILIQARSVGVVDRVVRKATYAQIFEILAVS